MSKRVIIGSMKKQCKYCGNYFDELDFGVAKTTKNKVYRRRKCKHCYRDTKKVLRKRQRVWLDKYKEEIGCCKCGIRDFRVLEFHHIDPDTKEFNVSNFYHHQFSIEKTEAEIKKCDVICANCHRVLHYVHRNGI